MEWKNKRNNVYNGCGRLRAFIQKKLMQFLLVLYWSTVHRLAYKTPPGTDIKILKFITRPVLPHFTVYKQYTYHLTCVNVSAFGQATAAVE